MKKTFSVLLGAFLVFLQTIVSHAQSFSLLHNFDTNSTPIPGLTLCGGILYGATYQRGNGINYSSGTVYSINTNGSNYTLLYSFNNNQAPISMPVVSGGWIYGATDGHGEGLIYCICTNGSNFSILHTFVNGMIPGGSLTLVNGTLFGVTPFSVFYGGQTNHTNFATIYSIYTNGSNFTVLHSFDNGEEPCGGPLALSDGKLYGMTASGGSNNNGLIYSVSTNGSNYNILHQFTDAEGNPGGDLVVSGTNLFGCVERGSEFVETVFGIGTGGGDLNLLHAFANGSVGPSFCMLLLGSNTLYGATQAGSSGTNLGMVFSIKTDGSGYNVQYDFTGTYLGVNPSGTLVFSGSDIFGIAIDGAAGAGAVFALTLPPPFFSSAAALDTPEWYWLGPQGSATYGFGYFSAAYTPYIMHEDLGWEYFVDAANATSGGYFYDFTDGVWFYTEPGIFPYLFDYNQNAWMYCAPQDGAIDRYQTNPRWFLNTSTMNWVNNL